MAELRIGIENVSGNTLDAVATNATGTAVGDGQVRSVATVVAVGTGTLTGTLTIEGSLDNVTWVTTGTTVSLTAAATVTTTDSTHAFRYYRTSLSGAAGTGTCTANMGIV